MKYRKSNNSLVLMLITLFYGCQSQDINKKAIVIPITPTTTIHLEDPTPQISSFSLDNQSYTTPEIDSVPSSSTPPTEISSVVTSTYDSIDNTFSWYTIQIRFPDSSYSWENIPITSTPHLYNFPIVAKGKVNHNIQDNISVESPASTIFTIIEYSGTSDDWLTLVRSQEPTLVREDTIQHVRFDTTQSILYQTIYTGLTGEEGVYILKASESTILLIETDFINSDPLLPNISVYP